MEIASSVVGLKSAEYRTEIAWRQTTNYAASVADMNPLYFDDRREEGLIAPPTFAFALTWPIISKIHDYIDFPYPPELLSTIVHYTEHVDFFRPLRPGDTVSIRGEVAAVLPHRAGTHVVFKFPVQDLDGRPIHTEYVGGMLRGVKCADGGRGAENLPTVPRLEATAAGAPVWEVPVAIGKEAPYVYDGCSGLAFAIHTSPRFAEAVGLPGIILHGTATLAHAVREIVNREAGGDPTKVRALAARFSAMVFPGTSIRVQLLERHGDSTGARHIHFRVLNDQGHKAISGGYARVEG